MLNKEVKINATQQDKKKYDATCMKHVSIVFHFMQPEQIKERSFILLQATKGL
jgi:hypothetical protein